MSERMHISSINGIKYLIFFLILLTTSCKNNLPIPPIKQIPRIWTSYSVVHSLEEDFADMADKGIEVVDMNPGQEEISMKEILAAARKHNLKIATRINMPSVEAFNTQTPDTAVFIGGAYNKKAIDRFRFNFTREKHEILIEKPVYHKEAVYGAETGNHFYGADNAVKAEVIVKVAPYSQKQFVTIIPAQIVYDHDVFWKMSFDLTGVPGDMDNVMLAVYWKGLTNGHRFKNNPSAFNQSTHLELKHSVRSHIYDWKESNGGKFPSDVVFAIRFDDEEWLRSAHTYTSESVSYPLWDYSDAAVKYFSDHNPGMEYPRGKDWIDVFGREAYARWMYYFHKNNAKLVYTIKEALQEVNCDQLLVFRNITRSDVFSYQNDHDGTGLELLSRAFDILHLDPYPVKSTRYDTITIPRDMAYMEGMARRFKKLLVPWVQAHQYYPEGYFGLTHPNNQQVSTMFNQIMQFNTDAIIWLGYGKAPFNTFPEARPEVWQQITEIHQRYRIEQLPKAQASIAVVRPYNVRAIRGVDNNYPQDEFFNNSILHHLVFNMQTQYDPFEPLSCSQLNPSELQGYKLVFATVGCLSEKEIKPFLKSGVPSVILIQGADITDHDLGFMGVMDRPVSFKGQNLWATGKTEQDIMRLNAAEGFITHPDVKVFNRVGGMACAWQYKNIIFISFRTANHETQFNENIWNILGENAVNI